MKNMIEKRKEQRGQGGFTLIELLVVIAILGILAGVVVFAIGNITGGAKESACDIEKRSLQTAIEAARATSSSTDTWGDFIEDTSVPTYWTVGAAPANTLSPVTTQQTAAGTCTPV